MSSAGFDPSQREALRQSYPERQQRLRHSLPGHSLLTRDALIELAHAMRPQDVMCFSGAVPVDASDGGAPRSELTPEETIRGIETNRSWMVFKSADQHPAYAALMSDLLSEIESVVLPATGPMMEREAFIFVSSPGSITPFHLDPEHNILIQVEGSKMMTVFPQVHDRIATAEAHEAFHHSGNYTLPWDESYAELGTEHRLDAGDALYVPVKAPHFVRNGDAPSISLSITWRSAWSWDEADARNFNRVMRNIGLSLDAPQRWPQSNRAKAYSYRALRKLRLAS